MLGIDQKGQLNKAGFQTLNLLEIIFIFDLRKKDLRSYFGATVKGLVRSFSEIFRSSESNDISER